MNGWNKVLLKGVPLRVLLKGSFGGFFKGFL